MGDLQVLDNGQFRYLGTRLANQDEATATRYLTRLLSSQDSIASTGSSFIDMLRTGKAMSGPGVVGAFTLGSALALKQLGDQSALTPSEQVVSATLISYTIKTGTVTLSIRLVTAQQGTKIDITVTLPGN